MFDVDNLFAATPFLCLLSTIVIPVQIAAKQIMSVPREPRGRKISLSIDFFRGSRMRNNSCVI